ncbi:hypothetical protein EOD42_17105 [Rhodovarius crocodyli]|uniref:Uncharacterized protein n=1 Tax=Rhodovarius crocodyli TaxID=1979269 RepID=A0A437MCD3_9PROT|nr:hypothetical protein [Rhodovarius crocodyli]RVT95301.1 hypothetical protein EOD42_17105 [Rhodovarius crocodyli]
MRRRTLLAAASLLATPAIRRAEAQRPAPPHSWIFGSWIGGQFPPGDGNTTECFGGATVIFTRDVVLRASALDIAYRQRVIETVALIPDGLEFRFAPAAAQGGVLASRLPPDIGFSCDNNPDLLRVQRRGPNEIAFPGCVEFPAILRRCTTPG